jgi:uncharacterized membrane protein
MATGKMVAGQGILMGKEIIFLIGILVVGGLTILACLFTHWIMKICGFDFYYEQHGKIER